MGGVSFGPRPASSSPTWWVLRAVAALPGRAGGLHDLAEPLAPLPPWCISLEIGRDSDTPGAANSAAGQCRRLHWLSA